MACNQHTTKQGMAVSYSSMPETLDIVSLLLISTDVAEYQFLATSAGENGVVAVTYDTKTSVATFLEELIKDPRVHPAKFHNIGWICHGFKQTKLQLLSDVVLDAEEILGTLGFVPSQQITDLFVGLGQLAISCKHKPRIDLLACCLALNPRKFAAFAGAVKTSTGVGLAASTDLTGNVTDGNAPADWILEIHGVDATELYFNKSTLQKYNYYALYC
jgi:hypothetical protein